MGWTRFTPSRDSRFSRKSTQSPAKHRYPPLILFLKGMIKCVETSIASRRGKTKGSSSDRSCQESFLIRPLFDTKHQNAAGLLAWCAVSKTHAGLCRECFETDGFYGVDWNQTTSEHITFVLFFFLSFVFHPLLFLSEDRRFPFHLCPGFEARLINVVLILKPLLRGKKSKPILSWAIKHSERCRSGTAGCGGARVLE